MSHPFGQLKKFGAKTWKRVAGLIPTRTEVECTKRWNELQNHGTAAKRPWSLDEDRRMLDLVAAYGAGKWAVIASYLPGRNGKQCRERWHNQLNPTINRDPWSLDEDDKIILLQAKHGNKWASIAKYFEGRTDNAIKNRWYSSLQARVQQKLKRASYNHKRQSQRTGSVDRYETQRRCVKSVTHCMRSPNTVSDFQLSTVGAHAELDNLYGFDQEHQIATIESTDTLSAESETSWDVEKMAIDAVCNEFCEEEDDDLDDEQDRQDLERPESQHDGCFLSKHALDEVWRDAEAILDDNGWCDVISTTAASICMEQARSSFCASPTMAMPKRVPMTTTTTTATAINKLFSSDNSLIWDDAYSGRDEEVLTEMELLY